MSTVKSACYIRFLNLIDVLDRINPGKKLDSTEEKLLDKIILSFHAKQAVLVGDLIFNVHDDGVASCLDAKTGEDLTRNLLLQIILEEESAGAPMFTEAVLANIIRFYGHAMQGHMGAYLESNLQSLMLMQSKMGHQSQNIVSQMQEQMQKQTAQFLNAFGLKP